MKAKLGTVNRVEVIDQEGRAYTNYDCKNVRFEVQDGGETLKVFLINLT